MATGWPGRGNFAVEALSSQPGQVDKQDYPGNLHFSVWFSNIYAYK